MKKTTSVILFVAIVVVSLFWLGNKIFLSNQYLVASKSLSIVLGKPTGTTVALNLLSAQDTSFSVVYGADLGNLDKKSRSGVLQSGVPLEVELAGLLPDAQYYYTIVDDKSHEIGVGKFHTARAVGSSFTFAIQADPHMDEQSDAATYRQTLAMIGNNSPDFMIDLGDTFMTDKLSEKNEKNILDRYLLMRSFYEKTTRSVPLFFALGNHDGEAGWDFSGRDTGLALFSHADRLSYYPNPAPNAFYSGNQIKENNQFLQDYYAFTWGDALFVVLDPYKYTAKKPNSNGWGWTLGEVQYAWLQSTLETSTARHKFVFTHQLVGGDSQGRGGVEFAKYYEWGGNNADGSVGFATNRPGWSKPIHRLLVDNSVEAVFKGHDHFFAKQELDGVVYQTLPQPSHAGNAVPSAQEYGYTNGTVIGGSGYLRVNVSSGNVRVDFVSADREGTLLNSYTLGQ
ncbi:MAG: metallophosphoesterase [bacterium]